MTIASKVHERQAEGLVHFAERLQWPYLEELRAYATQAYAAFSSGGLMQAFLHDWLHGLMLPGQWMAVKKMGAMILCTPSREEAMPSNFFDSGVVVEGPKGESYSYWRSRTAMGRVLAPLPGVVSLCGWVGRCPAVELVSSLSMTTTTTPSEKTEGEPKKKLRHIRGKAERIAPITIDLESEEALVYRYDYLARRTAMSIRPGLAAMRDRNKWTMPRPKAQTETPRKVALAGIKLTRRPHSAGPGGNAGSEEPLTEEDEARMEYEARITFGVGEPGGEKEVSYDIKTSPLLISLPACKPPKGAEGHAVQEREREQYEVVAWPADRLGEYDGEVERVARCWLLTGGEPKPRSWRGHGARKRGGTLSSGEMGRRHIIPAPSGQRGEAPCGWV